MVTIPTSEEFEELKNEVRLLHKKLDYAIGLIEGSYNAREYTQKEAAKLLNISVETLAKRRKAGQIGYLPNPIRYSQVQIDEYRKNHKVPVIKW